MPKRLQKSLHHYLSKIKKSPTKHIHLPSKTLSSPASWILRGCKHPKTLSFAANDRNPKQTHNNNGDEDRDDDAATLEDIDRFMFENFKSLYLNDDDDNDEEDNNNNNNNKKTGLKDDHEEKTNGFSLELPRVLNPPPDLYSSHRFFVGNPSSSSSLMEKARTSSSTTATTATTNESTARRVDDDNCKRVMGPDDFIALFTYSPSPYNDFKDSMQEMIEARVEYCGKVDWEFMEELLFCYLDLNDKKSYKYILSAFVDLVVILRENSGKIPAGSWQRRRE
ncbi:hypothetical protein ACSBR2_042841 [Camellia fascicularis]